MSFRELPSYLRPTISSVSQSSTTPLKRTPGNGTPAKKTHGNLTPGRRTPGNASLAKVLSPLMSPSRGRVQDKEAQNFRDNPLFGGNESDAVDGSSGHPSSSLKTAKITKGNGGTEEPGRNRAQGGTKQGNTTPGKTPRVPTMLSGTPPKFVLRIVKRSILSDSNENVSKHIGSSIPRQREEIVQPCTSNEAIIRKWGDEKVPTTDSEMMKSPEPGVNESSGSGPQVSAVESKGFRRSSVEDLQKRIQKFLETRVTVETMLSPMLTNQCSLGTSVLSEEMNREIPVSVLYEETNQCSSETSVLSEEMNREIPISVRSEETNQCSSSETSVLSEEMNREIPISVLSEEMNREIPEVSSQDAFLTPARSSEPLAEKNIFLTPQTKIMEDSSSLGRFTAFVPIVRKKLRGICPSRTRKVSDFDARSRAKYDSSTRASPQWDSFSWETERPSSRQPKEEEEFYGLGDFFKKDVQISIEDFFRDLQAVGSKMEKQDAKPKSLWEELAEIGEEFVEFLEKELNITDSSEGDKSAKYRPDFDTRNTKNKASYESNIPEEEKEKKRVESEIAEIEEMLAKIKKEMGI